MPRCGPELTRSPRVRRSYVMGTTHSCFSACGQGSISYSVLGRGCSCTKCRPRANGSCAICPQRRAIVPVQMRHGTEGARAGAVTATSTNTRA
eukprot:268295-Alexandrium_andersonii.AAC.2